MIQLQKKPITNTWLKADWETYINTIDSHEHDRGYYYNGEMRIEDMPTGADHATDNGLIYLAITLFCMVKGIQGLIGCSYRKIGIRECQPDISFYIGDRAKLSPTGTSIVNLDERANPNLVVEISNTTIADDLGSKRLLYEEMGVTEYWVVDVQNCQIYAFEMLDRGSKRIDISLALPQLSIATIVEALNRSKESDQTQIGQWLMNEFKI
jgi:Uma2 family endonuclease